ncbi:PilT protein domain protein [Methylorubrum populi BJ001]|uniref:Ribonuclease VapC n=1 Tax=Methylorubrum populi (strain ATCC BAA-705 / NCIMB 13946 / BJ001) TaxID=441620 RepID=B1Z8W4_METPB|nr:type II toxin-antitoxin system VapC family toxin [Methylorubrum populi]ACB83264.1 PilT protein domain protein [Methylorubrum populi BJ001]OAH38231.1 twitching motility protein PilT [Methylorubrum populi]PZP68214.1 MAG: type II toxin-antitoxin system VapC family toxin [Methylorubrum populi]
MTSYLLDTNIISNVIKPDPSPRLLAWMAEQQDSELFIASVTLGEIRRGILQLPDGRKRARLETWFSGEEGPLAFFAGRILPFDADAAMVWARLMADGRLRGRPRDAIDMMLAAIAQAHGLIVVTDNERDFDGLSFFNPVRDGSRLLL